MIQRIQSCVFVPICAHRTRPSSSQFREGERGRTGETGSAHFAKSPHYASVFSFRFAPIEPGLRPLSSARVGEQLSLSQVRWGETRSSAVIRGFWRASFGSKRPPKLEVQMIRDLLCHAFHHFPTAVITNCLDCGETRLESPLSEDVMDSRRTAPRDTRGPQERSARGPVVP